MDDVLRAALESIARSIEKFCTIFAESENRHDATVRSAEKRYEDLLRATEKHADMVAERQQQHTDELHTQQLKHNEDLQKKQHLANLKVALLSTAFGVAALGAGLIWHTEANHADAQMHMQTTKMTIQAQKETQQMDLIKLELQQRYHKESILQDQVSELREKIKNYFALRDKLMMAMGTMREVVDYGQEQCVDGKYTGKDQIQYKEKSLNAIYNLVGLLFEINNVFNADIFKAASHFGDVAYSKNVCAKNATTSDELRPIQVNINKMIVASIDELKTEKTAKENQLKNEESMINNILENNIQKKKQLTGGT